MNVMKLEKKDIRVEVQKALDLKKDLIKGIRTGKDLKKIANKKGFKIVQPL